MFAYNTGIHLFNCKVYPHCGSKYFKCPGYYCIPWRYRCDKLWHCPFGADEKDCAKDIVSCPGMFRCLGSVICLAMEDICNNYTDCLLTNEDEHMCDPHIPKCPKNCNCLGYVINCRNITSKIYLHNCTFPYLMVSIKESDLFKFDIFMKMFNEIHYLLLWKVNLSSLCLSFDKATNLMQLEHLMIVQNKVRALLRQCFNYRIPGLSQLNISHNSIINIEEFSFSDLNKLRSLDISFNAISELKRDVFHGVKNLVFLNIKENPILFIDMDVLQPFKRNLKILTESYKICCLESVIILDCAAEPQWPNSCHRLFNDKAVRIMFWLVGILGCYLNFFSVIVGTEQETRHPNEEKKKAGQQQQKPKKGKEKSKRVYGLIVKSIAFGDSLVCLTLLIIAGADEYIGKEYVQYDIIWKQHALCLISSMTYIASNLVSVFSLNIMAISRYSVVKLPFDSTYLRFYPVIFQLVVGVTLSTLLAGTLSIIYKLHVRSGALPSGLCLLIGNIDKSFIPTMVTIFTLVSQGISVFSIPVLYTLLLFEIRKQDKKMADQSQGKKSVSNAVLVSMTNIITWIPCVVMLTLTLAWEKYPFKMLIWMTAIILPLNAILNPFIFVMIPRGRKLRKRFTKTIKDKMNSQVIPNKPIL